MLRRVKYTSAAAISIFIIGCGTTETGINKGQLNVFGTQDEIKLGQQYDKEVRRQMKVLNDTVITDYATDLANRLYAYMPEMPVPGIKATIILSDQVNAFALPGGYVYINTELLRTVDNEAELAGVVAHEVGHVIARHGTEQVTKAYGVSVVAGIVGGRAGQAVRLFGNLGILSYGREAELEADGIGLNTIYAANYDIHAMESMLKKLQALQKTKPNKMTQFFSTHPPIEERITKSREYAASLPKQNSPKITSDAFRVMKQRLPK